MTDDLPTVRIAVTGAPGTGRTTVCTALALATGLDCATVSEDLIAPRTGGRLAPTVEAAVRGFEYRVDGESRLPGSFVSDGSVLHEWALAEAVRRTTPRRHWLLDPLDLPYRIFEERFLLAHHRIVARRANATYDGFVHLRVPDDADANGDNALRELVDRLLLDTLQDSNLPYLVIGGSLEQIVTQVAGMYALPQRIPVGDAVSAALEAA
ncbi:AAA family ATPase [Nocardia higoensis]|uniref:AAA family ATPase n=1 Tax=Nocardia higoensis TaxID=228599 RepID=UPI00030CBA18|nr:AAA family ATPase [Nocardia higoensis]